MADKITDKQNVTAGAADNFLYAKRKVSSKEVQQPMFGMGIDREALKKINSINREKLERINSINSLAAKLTPKEKKKYSDDKTKFSWPYNSLPSADKMDNYSISSLDIIFSQVIIDYNGTDGKQDGIIGDFQQGDAGDCWFLAEIKFVSNTPEGAEIIKNSIKNNNNGTFTVTFKGAPNKNYPVTEKEIRKSKDKFSDGDKDVRILEIAADKWRLETQGKSIDKAGTSLEANFLLTGQKNTMAYYSSYKNIDQRTITNDKNIDKPKRKTIARSIEPIEALQKIPEGQLLRLSFSETNNKDETFKTQNGDSVYTQHGYYIERKGNEIYIHDPHDTAKPAVRMTLSECANREFVLTGSNLDFILRKKEEKEGLLASPLSLIHKSPIN